MNKNRNVRPVGIPKILELYWEDILRFTKQYQSSRGYRIPVSVFFEKNFDITALRVEFVILGLQQRYKEENLEFSVLLEYNREYILVRKIMDKKLFLEFSYLKRDDFIESCYLINELVSENGFVQLAVNNIPGMQNAALYVECTSEEYEKVAEVVKQVDFAIRTDKGAEELMIEAGNRLVNLIGFFPKMPRVLFENAFNSLFFYTSQKDLEKKGYIFETKLKPRVFISYSHRDKNIVYSIIEKFNEYGVNVFIDAQSIDFGENILEAYTKGINESVLFVVFMSESYKISYYAKNELSIAFNEMILKKKKIFPVKLDDVDPNEILYGLSGYKYFQYQENDVQLVTAILNTLKCI